MGSFKGLKLVGNTWVVRKGVPAELRAQVGKRELLRSLQTGDPVEARRFYPAVWAEFERIIADARAEQVAEASGSTINPKEIARLLNLWVLAEADKPLPAFDDLTTPWHVQHDIDLYAAAHADPTAWRQIVGIDDDVVALMASVGIAISPKHRAFPEVRRGVIQARKIVFEHREKQRLARAWSNASHAATATPQAPPPVFAPKPSHMTVQGLYDDWVAKVAKPPQKERGRLDHQIRRFIEFLGADRPINLVTKAEVVEFLAMLARYPTGDQLLVECGYCALIRLLDPLEACVAFGEEATFAQIEAQPCPRCGIKNDSTQWQRAKVATAEDLLRIAHPGRGGGRGNGRSPRKRRAARWADS